jgi:hypothetical protein
MLPRDFYNPLRGAGGDGTGLKRSFSSSRRKKWIRFMFGEWACRRFHWPRGLRRGSAVTRLPGLRVRIPPWAWMSVSCDCFVLSCTGLCDGPISRPGESYRVGLCASLNVIRCIHNPLHQPFLTWGPRTLCGSMDKFQGVRELGWEENYNFIFTNLWRKFRFEFNNGCRKQGNLWYLDSKNI